MLIIRPVGRAHKEPSNSCEIHRFFSFVEDPLAGKVPIPRWTFLSRKSMRKAQDISVDGTPLLW
jgi:hypothetical protein